MSVLAIYANTDTVLFLIYKKPTYQKKYNFLKKVSCFNFFFLTLNS